MSSRVGAAADGPKLNARSQSRRVRLRRWKKATSFSGDTILDDAHRMRRRALDTGDAAGAQEQQRRIGERTQRNKALGEDFREWDEFTPEIGAAGREPDQPSGEPLPRAGFDPDAFLGAVQRNEYQLDRHGGSPDRG